MASRIKVLRQRKADLIKEAGLVFDAVRTEGRDLTDPERERDDQITADLDTLNGDIQREERHLERERDLAGGTFREEDPASVNQEQKKFTSLGEQLVAVANAAQPGRGVDPRLMIGAAPLGLSEGVKSDGGFLVQTDFSSELLRETMATGILSSRTRRITIGANSNGLKMNAVNETSRVSSRFGGIIAYLEVFQPGLIFGRATPRAIIAATIPSIFSVLLALSGLIFPAGSSLMVTFSAIQRSTGCPP